MLRVVRIIVALLSLAPVFASAHSLGASLERTVGDYWIDIGYDPAQIMAGDRMVLDFNLADAAATNTRAAFDSVWVRLLHQKQTVLATGIDRPEIGPTTLLYAIPRDAKGDMTISVRYQKDGETLAESDFTIPVTPYEDPKWWWPFAGVAAAAVLSAAGAAGFMQWKTRRRAGGTPHEI